MKIISLFSGAGGLDLGLIQSGHDIVSANDIDKDAVATYMKNIGSNIVNRDIAEIDADSIPDAEVVVGGFPCQGFSQANLKRCKDDCRNKLYIHFLRIVKNKRPLYFLAENVRGILSLDKGNVMKQIVDDFSSIGYRVQYKLFNTADYGVPQTRQRVIIAGVRHDLPEGLDYKFPDPTHFNPAKKQTSQSLLTNNLGTKKKQKNLLPWITITEALRNIPEPRNGDDLLNNDFSKYKLTNRNFTGHRRTDPNKPSPTILARGNGGGGVCAIPHPLNHRRMSVRESATIQTFPLEMEFVGGLNSCYRQVGNAVPVLFAKRLGEQLKNLERYVIR